LRKFILGMIIVVLFSLVLLATDFNGIGSEVPESYPVRNLNTRLNYTTIQEAIDAAETSEGHVIFVEKGMYYEQHFH
jgi:pectin methylesterase-like acyl-CoA thioesterase